MIIVLLLVLTTIIPNISSNVINLEESNFSNIDNISNKVLMVDEIIGDKHVLFWEHKINDVYIKNDYILIHKDIDTGKILKSEMQWTEIKIKEDSTKDYFKPQNYINKQFILFASKEDETFFYEFNENIDFPVLCLEVYHTNGEIILYDKLGEIIGYGTPAPYSGFSMSGFHEPDYPDPWLNWRLNADSWYSLWSESTISVSFPTPNEISSYISDTDYELFYEIAHGGSTYFKATQTQYYYASDVTQAIEDREPLKFVFIGSCGGLDNIDSGTWSYEFRKGQDTDTVCVGYTGMASCPGWSVSLPWQDLMFYSMNSGLTIKDSFDYACSEYPTIAPCVVFTGDVTLKIFDEEEPEEPDFIIPNVFITYPNNGDIVKGKINITGTSDHLDGIVKYVYVKVGDDDWKKAEGTDTWTFEWDTTTFEDGEVIIQAVSIDTHGLQSGVRYATVLVKNEEEPEEPKIPDLETEGEFDWPLLNPGESITDSFSVKNIGEAESELDWKITDWPEWGTWSMQPIQGLNLNPEDGEVEVEIQLTAPEDQEKIFTGEIKVVNIENPEDSETMPITLTTIKSKSRFIYFQELIGRFVKLLSFIPKHS